MYRNKRKFPSRLQSWKVCAGTYTVNKIQCHMKIGHVALRRCFGFLYILSYIIGNYVQLNTMLCSITSYIMGIPSSPICVECLAFHACGSWAPPNPSPLLASFLPSILWYTLLAVLFKGLDGFPHFLTMLCTSFFFANSCHQAPLTQTIGTGNLSILCTLVTLKCPMI
jgi:hypothetical protein